MAETYGFFNGDEEYTQDDLLSFFKTCFRSGIDVADDGTYTYPITINGSTGVTIGPGYGLLEGCFNHLTTPKACAIDTPTSYPRIDRIVIRVDYGAATCLVAVKKGTEASAPQPPALERNNERWELSLCQVKKTTAGTITTIDERQNEAVCGDIRPRNLPAFNAWFSSIKEMVSTWFETQQGLGWREFYVQATEPAEIAEGGIWRKITT